MAPLPKIVFAATLAAALAAGILQGRHAACLRQEVQALQRQQAPLTAQLRQLERERDAFTNRLAAVEEENAWLKSDQPAAELARLRTEAARWRKAATPLEAAEVKSSLAKVELLKERLEQTPNAKIPEFQFLAPENWLAAAGSRLTTDDDFRRAFSALRTAGEGAFARQLQPALKGYVQAHKGEFPTDLSQLQPFFKAPVDDALLQRWQIAPKENYSNIGDVGSQWVVTQKAAVDEEYDTCAVLGPAGSGWCQFKIQKAWQTLLPVFESLSHGGHDGQEFISNGHLDLSRLKPYAQTPAQQAALDLLIQKEFSAEN